MRINSTNTDRLIFHGWVNKYPICVLLCKEQWKEKWDKHQTKSMRFWIGDKTSAKITKTYHNQMNSFHYPAMSMFASHCTMCTMTQNFAGSHKLKKKKRQQKTNLVLYSGWNPRWAVFSTFSVSLHSLYV